MPTVILLGSELRFAWGAGAAALARLAADAGFDGVAVGPACTRRDVPLLAAAAASAGVPLLSSGAPLPEARLQPGKRLPFLAATEDAEERRAAAALFDATVDALAPLGVRLFTVNFGDVPLGTAAPAFVRRFARNEIDEGEPGARLWADALAERRARSPEILDACRYSLDLILGAVERRGAALALEISGGPWGAPSSREAEILVAEYGSAPLGIVWDEARVQVLERLGAGLPDARRANLVAAARLWRAGDNVGIEVGYLPGMGDRAPSVPDPLRADAVPVVVTGWPDCTLAEVTAARALVAARPTAPPPAAPNAAPPDQRPAST